MIDWKVFVATFGTVFLAELGDKTQIATLGAAAARQATPWSVFLGSAAALVACSAIAVVVGAALSRAVPIVWLERAGAALLVVLGAWMLVRSFAGGAE